MIGPRRYRAQSVVEEGELHVDVMRFFAVIALCLFAVLSAVGGQRDQAVSQTAKSSDTAERSAPLTSLIRTTGDEVEELSASPPSQGMRFENHFAFQQAVVSGAVTLWQINAQYQYRYEVESGQLLPSVMSDELFFTIGEADAIKFLDREDARRRSNAAVGDWYITLPKATLNQVGQEFRKASGWVVLDGSASIARP
jgi:hypothetical protein